MNAAECAAHLASVGETVSVTVAVLDGIHERLTETQRFVDECRRQLEGALRAADRAQTRAISAAAALRAAEP